MAQPKLLSKIWASLGLKTDIPETRTSDLAQSAATYEEGFPSITMTPIAQGGKAPSGKDMNGILRDITEHIVYQNKGGVYLFDASFAEKIGGYDKGAVLITDDYTKFMVSLVDENKVDFNTSNYQGSWAVIATTDLVRFIAPKNITASSKNTTDITGHSHAIDSASTTQKGIVQLTNDTGLDSEVLALTAKAGKAIAQSVAQLQLSTTNALNQKVNKTNISNAVNSTSQTTVASSQAVKTAYDKGVEAKNAADKAQSAANAAQQTANAKQSPATTLAGYGIADFKVTTLTSEDLNTIQVAGNYGQSMDANATSERHYPENKAGSLLVIKSAYDWKQVYLVWNSGRIYVRNKTSGGVWLGWVRVDAIDSVNKSGDTMTGTLNIKVSDYSSVRTYNSSGYSVRWECAPASVNEMAAVVYATPTETVQFKAIFPKKNGTVAYVSDITKTAVGLGSLENHAVSNSGGSNNYVLRDSAGDVTGRLFRSTYNDQSNISGAIAFRVNNSTDNYTRYCNSPAAVRTWLGLHASATRAASWSEITGKPAQATRWPNSVEQGFTQSLSDNGWVRLPNGLVIQWFAFDFGDAGNNAAKTISFPLAFKKTLNVFLSSAAGDTGGSGSDGVEITSVNNTSMIITSYCQSRKGFALMRCFAVGLL